MPGSIAQGIFRPAAPPAILATATRPRQDTRDFLSGAYIEFWAATKSKGPLAKLEAFVSLCGDIGKNLTI
jgi:hypothetical protein